MRIIFTCLITLLALAIPASAHELITTRITWSREISRIVYKHCLSCHREGGMAFSLANYQQARPWAKAIKAEVLERRMPPWGAMKGFGDFRNDVSLTQEEVNLIAHWVEGGAPQGDPQLLPEFPAAGPAVEPPAISSQVAIEGSFVFDKDWTAVGIRPASVEDGGSLRVIAVGPDGTSRPLLWLYNHEPRFKHDFYFEQPIRLAAGIRIEIHPAEAGSVSLLASDDPVYTKARVRAETHPHHRDPETRSSDPINATSTSKAALSAIEDGTAPSSSVQQAALIEDQPFICPMDPEVRSGQPGKCSRCGMDLVVGIPERLEYPVDVHLDPAAVQPREPVELSFAIMNPQTQEPVKNFQVVHEKLLHLFVVSGDLRHFRHDHPALTADGTFRITTAFPKQGLYRLAADFYPEGGTPQFVVKTVIVPGEAQGPMPLSADLKPDLSAQRASNLDVELVTEPAEPIAGLKTLMFFRLTPADGLEPYLGAWGHMLAVSDDQVDMIHDHPFLAGGGPQVQFNMIFPRARTYRVWVQFQRHGVVNTAAFNVPVRELK